MELGIVAQRGNARAVGLADRLRGTLADVDVVVDETTAESLDAEGVPVDRLSECDLVVSIGGDGTFLYAARGAGTTPILGVNLGEVGFLNAVDPDDAVETVRGTVRRVREGDLAARSVPRLRVEGENWSLRPAINEVVVQGPRRGHGGGASIEVRVDGSLYAGSRADGVMVASATGSTAYNLSEGGPIVHPDVAGMVVTEMCATDPMPSLVVDGDSEVTVRIDDAPSGVAVSDGRAQRDLDPPASVTVTADGDPVRLAGPSVDFFEALGKLE